MDFEYIKQAFQKLYCLVEGWVKPRRVVWSAQVITESRNYVAPDGCTGVSFKNTGNANATIGGFPLNAGDPMLSFPLQKGELEKTKWQIKFAAGSNPQIWVWVKIVS
jgi:hypothetical protein